MLHFVAGRDDPAGIVAAFRGALAPGSALVVSHGSFDRLDPHQASAALASYTRSTAAFHPRTRDQITAWFDGMDLLDPGVVHLSQWRPDPEEDAGTETPAGRSGYAAVARRLP